MTCAGLVSSQPNCMCSRSGPSGQKVLAATCDWLNERKIQRYNFPLYFINTTQKRERSWVQYSAKLPLPRCYWVGFQTDTDFYQMIKHPWQLGSYSWKNKGTKFLFSENPRHKYRQVWLQDVVLKLHTVHSYKGSKLTKCDLRPRTTLTVLTSQILPKV